MPNHVTNKLLFHPCILLFPCHCHDGLEDCQVSADCCRGEFLALFIYSSRRSSQEIDQLLNVERLDLVQMQMSELGNENSLDSGLIKQICGG